MKKTFFFTILLAMSLPAQAQRTKSVGLRAGVNVSNITRTVFSARTAFYAGLTGEMRMTDLYALQIEAGYSQQGAQGDVKTRRSVNRDFWASGIQSHYFTAGIMNKFTFNRTFSFMAGISGEQELSRNPFLTRTLDFGVVAGAEYKFLPGFGLEVRAKRGLFDIFENSAYTTGEYTGNLLIGSHANLVFQAGLVYYFK
ncbi:MAG: PorT family protein [Leadbetterella sp.]|nr:PorT family protein [Leadbetterella sp.]